MVEQDRLDVLKHMLQDAASKRLRNTELANNEGDDKQWAKYQRIATDAARSKCGITQDMRRSEKRLPQRSWAIKRWTTLPTGVNTPSNSYGAPIPVLSAIPCSP